MHICQSCISKSQPLELELNLLTVQREIFINNQMIMQNLNASTFSNVRFCSFSLSRLFVFEHFLTLFDKLDKNKTDG